MRPLRHSIPFLRLDRHAGIVAQDVDAAVAELDGFGDEALDVLFVGHVTFDEGGGRGAVGGV